MADLKFKYCTLSDLYLLLRSKWIESRIEEKQDNKSVVDKPLTNKEKLWLVFDPKLILAFGFILQLYLNQV